MTSPHIGAVVPGFVVPVIDERAVRAAAAILFLAGAVGFGLAAATGTVRPLQPFGMVFMIDMYLRVAVGDRWSPTLALGRFLVRRLPPDWVGAPQKAFAWWLGFGLAVVSCASSGLLAAPLGLTLALCAVCLSLLFIEAAFGICAGCTLQRVFSRASPHHCSGDACAVHT